jgi:hypothetical protein
MATSCHGIGHGASPVEIILTHYPRAALLDRSTKTVVYCKESPLSVAATSAPPVLVKRAIGVAGGSLLIP